MYIIPIKYSFKLISRNTLSSIVKPGSGSARNGNNKHSLETDNGKRNFLKVAGIAGVGLVASQLLPKKAEALIMGSTPSSSVVGVKNISNVRIDPATETTLALIQAKTANLTFDGSNNLLTASTGGTSSVTVKDTTSTQVNPATDDSAMLLRRLVKQVDSLAVVDTAQRQKITLDAISASLTLGTVTTVSTLTSATNLVALGGVDGRYLYIDTARNASANGIRSNLVFS